MYDSNPYVQFIRVSPVEQFFCTLVYLELPLIFLAMHNTLGRLECLVAFIGAYALWIIALEWLDWTMFVLFQNLDDDGVKIWKKRIIRKMIWSAKRSLICVDKEKIKPNIWRPRRISPILSADWSHKVESSTSQGAFDHAHSANRKCQSTGRPGAYRG